MLQLLQALASTECKMSAFFKCCVITMLLYIRMKRRHHESFEEFYMGFKRVVTIVPSPNYFICHTINFSGSTKNVKVAEILFIGKPSLQGGISVYLSGESRLEFSHGLKCSTFCCIFTSKTSAEILNPISICHGRPSVCRKRS